MYFKALSIISSQLKRELNLRLIHYFGSGGQSAPIRRTVRSYVTWPTIVNLGHISTATSPIRGRSAPHSRTVRQCISGACHARRVWAPRPTLGPHSSARPLFTWEPSPSPLSPSHSPQTLLSLAKPWRSSPSSSLAIEALHHRSIAGGRQGTTPASYTTPISYSSLGRSFPNELFFNSISSPKPQARKTTPSYPKPSPSP